MKKFNHYINIAIGILLLIIVSCNQVVERSMDGYLEVEITNIDESESSIGLTLLDNNDSIVFANLLEDNFKNYNQIKSRCKVGDKLKINGIIHDFNYQKSHDLKKSSIILVKDLIFVD